MLGRIQIRRPSKTASPALCLFTNFDHFGNLVGGGSFGMENNDFSIDFPGSGLYLVCRCPFQCYIGEEMLDDGWRLTECAISCIFSMTISMKNDLGRETHTSRHVPSFVFFRCLGGPITRFLKTAAKSRRPFRLKVVFWWYGHRKGFTD